MQSISLPNVSINVSSIHDDNTCHQTTECKSARCVKFKNQKQNSKTEVTRNKLLKFNCYDSEEKSLSCRCVLSIKMKKQIRKAIKQHNAKDIIITGTSASTQRQ